MLARIPMTVRVFAGLAVILAMAGSARCDDPATVKQLQDNMTKLEKKIADLEAKVAALEKQAKSEPAKAGKDEEEYAKAIGGALLDGLLASDVSAVKGKMTQNLLKGIDSFWEVGSLNHDSKVKDWVGKWNADHKYKGY